MILGTLLPQLALSQEVTKLWPDEAIPNSIPGAKITEKSETDANGILRISNVSVPTITAYIPQKEKMTGAAVMICPGGGYGILAASHEGSDIARWFNEMGVAAFVLKYRLPNPEIMTNQQEVPLMDAMQGMTLIRQNAARYGIDPAKIGVMGFSAGGHLASTLATHYNRGAKASDLAKPNFAILLYPVVTFGEKAHTGSRDKLLGKLNASPEMVTYYSNELQVTAQTPPTFLVHAEDDKAVPVENSIGFYLACLKNAVPVEMHLYPTGGHGFGMRTAKFGSLNTWPDACKAWLTALTTPKP
ncbi:alpha/beta hydrolase fold domain-containing protein [Spirosoma sp. HMF4905]|uniref:Alpha/beta hydrolase fold domain-containing protein n=1 Tax=Spirosoma arboris TaxID=2682092 RepID=A0A7K1S6T9_9BACT|nr:alpha/beta hydrolase [Spirosoma arboris]MVM29552.1 alpha/beta hydrolase fold domain-containing protein [Spirosoma arboris]